MNMGKKNEPVKVLHITANLGIGGLERVVTVLCKNADLIKYKPAVCCLHFKGALSEDLEKRGIKVFLLSQKRKTDYFAFYKIYKLLRAYKPQVVHTHNINTSIDGILAAVLARVPIKIHTEHGRQFPDKKRYMFIEWVLSHFLNKIIAVSSETKDNLIKFEHISHKKIEIINNGVEDIGPFNSHECSAKKDELGLCEFKNIVGYAGRLSPEKGAIYLLSAVPEILARFPATGFVFAGEGRQKEFLLDESKRLGIDYAVKFIGPRKDIPLVLSVLDVYVLPSEREGLPMSLLEAMAAKCAIVASNVGGIPAAIEHGSNGLLTPPKSPEDIAGAITILLENTELRHTMGQKAREKFELLYTAKAMTRTYERLYEQFL
jgi:glycosyltransferase involved in cell wall biosynthesis